MQYRATIVGLAALTLLAFTATSASAGDGANLLPHAPDSGNIVLNLDLEQLRELPIYEPLYAIVMADPDAVEMLTALQAATGFDPNTDLSTLMLVMNGDNEDQFAALIEGTFDVEALSGYLGSLTDDVSSMDHGGQTVFFNAHSDADSAQCLTFLSDTVAVFGTQADVLAVLDSGYSIADNAVIGPLVAEVSMSSAMWFAGTLSSGMQSEVAGTPFDGMTHFRGDISLASGIATNYIVGAASEEQAGVMAETINALIMMAGTDDTVAALGLGSLLSLVTCTAVGTDVLISATIPEETTNMIYTLLTGLLMAEAQ